MQHETPNAPSGMAREGIDPSTPPRDTGLPDQVETDPAALNSAEDLDEDRLQVDPLEVGVEPPEQWSRLEDHNRTPREEYEDRPLDARIREDLSGEPFVGPAGGLLNRALDEAGIDRELVYVTNAVKHFKPHLVNSPRRVPLPPTRRS